MPDQSQIDEFKARIGFDSAPAAGSDDEGIVVEWPDPMHLSYFGEGGWSVMSQGLWSHAPGIAKRYWVLHADDAMVKIEVAVSSLGANGARQHLLEMAAQTMSVTIPYERGPDLGDVSISSKELPDDHALMWVHRNVFVQLTREQGESLLPLAEELQALMAEPAIGNLSSRLPRLEAFEVSSERVAVGESIEARAAVAPELSPRVLVRILDPDMLLLPVADEESKVRLRGAAPGTAKLVATVVDRESLLSSFESIFVEVYEVEGAP